MSEPLVIIGNGMAAARLVEELSTRALGRYAIAVIGKEPRLAYNRVLLSSVLAGEMSSTEIELKPASWWQSKGVTLHYGSGAEQIDVKAKTISLKDAQGESHTAPLMGKAVDEAKHLKAGDKVTATCQDNEKGEHQGVTALKKV